jgi:hypothetical protein
MATQRRKGPTQHWTVRFLPLQTLTNAQDLVQRFREVEGIRLYIRERQTLVIAATLVIVFMSIACAVGVVVFLADRHSLLALLGILLLPVALAGSFFVLAYVFFSWIEGRALARELGHRHRPPPGASALWLSKKFGLDMGPFPPVPWFLAALFLFVPLALLAAAWLSAALVVILLGILVPVVYAKFDA